jgi:hypothetical protein
MLTPVSRVVGHRAGEGSPAGQSRSRRPPGLHHRYTRVACGGLPTRPFPIGRDVVLRRDRRPRAVGQVDDGQVPGLVPPRLVDGDHEPVGIPAIPDRQHGVREVAVQRVSGP